MYVTISMLLGIAVAATPQTGRSAMPVFAQKPWATPVMPVTPPSTSLRPSTSSQVAKADLSGLPDASQSVMRKFVCQNRPKGLVYDQSSC